MLLADSHDDGHYIYAKVIGIHHVNVMRVANVYKTCRFEFLFVRWYESVQVHTWNSHTLGRVCFRPLENQNVFGFVDPGMVLRTCHIIPAFSRGQRNPGECGISPLAGDKHDWHEYYVNSFVDRDTLMRFHYGLGVGHIYSHEAGVVEMTVQIQRKYSESWGLMEHTREVPSDDDEDSDSDYQDEYHMGAE
ncbi:hypothetical protein CY34DRAFT_39089, partial [Suillus luteus UH-Slu-Lm8-n1]